MINRMHDNIQEDIHMKRINTITTRDMAKSQVTGGCGECQTSCQSASKTSCSVANQHCEQKKEK
jgi:predicted ribosomally synthesized six-cysteine peptide SCIFF